jgi:hypothetical protein
VNRDFREHLSVQADIGLRQTFDQSAIGNFPSAACSRKTDNPEASVRSFLLLAMYCRKSHCAIDGFGGLSDQFASRTPESAGLAKYAFSSFS